MGRCVSNIFNLLILCHMFLYGFGVELTVTPSPVTEGGSLTLACSVTENTSVYATFNQENGTSIGFVQLSGGQCIDGTGQNCTQQCSCTTDGKSFSWTISGVTRSWDKSRVRCTLGNPSTNSDVTVISVTYPPTGTLTVTPSGIQSVLTGTPVTLLCQVRGGNPLATLTWQCKGSTVAGQDLTNDTTAVSSLTFTVDRTYHQKQCVCTAGHQASPNGQFGTASVTFDVLYAPTVSTFAIDDTSPSYKGDNVDIDCMIEGGNPLATLSWTCVDPSKETYTNMDTTSRAVTRLTITSITEIYNNKQCTCTATHVGLSPSLTKSTVITVYYPPSTPTLSVDTTNGGALPWLDRPTFTGILTCTTTAGNPPTTRISWYNNGVRDPGQSAMTRRFEPPDKDYNGHTFTCRADNNYTDTKGVVVESDGLTLDIEYDPIITLNQSPVYINESLVFSRICSADGNPSPTVSWYRDSTLVQSDGTLQFSRTERQDAGTYTCTATARSTNGNVLLQSSKLLNIVVQYGPDVDLAFTNTTENTTNFRLRCTANGVPNQYTYRWIHKFGSTVIRDTFDHVTSSGSVSTLTIPRVTYQDMGTYICGVDNGYKGRDGQLVQTRQGFLAVEGGPHVIQEKPRYVSEKSTSLDITIEYISFPEPVNTTILRLDSTLPPQSELSITASPAPVTVSFYNKDVSIGGYMVNLHFNKFESKHRGHYQLHIRNVLGYRDYNFEIIISDKPDPPSGLDISQITDSSAVISWIPGDDNGNPQSFTVTYQKSTGGPQTNVTLNRTISSYTLENLDVSTKYDVTVYASNIVGVSDHIASSFSTISEKSGNAAVIGGTVGGAVVVILIVGLVVFVILRRRRPSDKKLEEEESDECDGLKANILYESAGPYPTQQPGQSNSNPSGDVYAVVDKPKPKATVTETQLYAEVNKPKKEPQQTGLYAEVKKKKEKAKNDTKVVKKHKKVITEPNGEGKKTKKGKKNKTDGMIYENVGAVDGTGKKERRDENDRKESGLDQSGLGKDDSSSTQKNAEGLVYIEVEFKEEDANKDKKFVIHGIENKTDYADVDFSKHAEPLPEENKSQPESKKKPV